MYITEMTSTIKSGKQYKSVLLRQSYREGGKVKNRTIANLTKLKPEEIEALKLALKCKGNLTLLGSIAENVETKEGQSIGAVWTLYEVARKLGIEKALGADRQGKLALWQVIARAMDQGSRLSAVRLAQFHAACDVLSLDRGFNENDMYDNLTWISKNQESVENCLFKEQRDKKPGLFLYDVTSSYFEGMKNELADWGYNRDKKLGKMQIVIGLLCDEEGKPVSIEVFTGNTKDTQTFGSQVKKAAERFGCENVTFVGDRGMIKSGQIEELNSNKFNYITAITKPQIKTLIKEDVIQLGLFDEGIVEVSHKNIRYILRRNPVRAEEINLIRQQKRKKIELLVKEKNKYIKEHSRAKTSTSIKNIRQLISKLKVNAWLKVNHTGHNIFLIVDEEALTEESLLDGCYVLKTDLPHICASAKVVHDRYKDLAMVERAFRTSKQGLLEMRPINVRTEEHTRAHVFVVMLSYLLVRSLEKSWQKFNITVAQGLLMLSTLSCMELRVTGKTSVNVIPQPREMSAKLLLAANIHLPKALPFKKCIVVTRHELQNHRKTA